jgi:hypothetical protein
MELDAQYKYWQEKLCLILGLLIFMIASPQSFSEEPSNSERDLSPLKLSREPIEDESFSVSLPPLSTSRPSCTDAVTTVPQGSIQVENGATYTANRGGTYGWTVPETLLRLGLTNNTELRYTVPNYIYNGDNQPGWLASNFGDTSVGLSHHLLLPKRVDMALVPILNLPTGANKVSSNSLDPQLRLVLGKTVTPKWFMSSHIDTRWNTGKAASAGLVLNPTFINYYSFTKTLTGFLEYSGFYPNRGKTIQYLQSGALYLLTPRQQLDVRIAVGLNKNSPNILVGFGYSFRIDGLFGRSKEYASFPRLRR